MHVCDVVDYFLEEKIVMVASIGERTSTYIDITTNINSYGPNLVFCRISGYYSR
jgi:hypothetical protein